MPPYIGSNQMNWMIVTSPYMPIRHALIEAMPAFSAADYTLSDRKDRA